MEPEITKGDRQRPLSDSPAHRPRVAIVDGDRRVRQSLADLLTIAGVEVVGSAGDVESAVTLIDRTQPRVLLVDPRLPDIDAGAALLTAITAHHPGLRVVLMGWSDPMERPSLLEHATAYLPKASEADAFVAAALAAAAGQ